MSEETEEKPCNFHEMELDDRILKAIAKLGWQIPTLIQEKAIPLLLEGKDVLVRARTGSGKTAAFAIPVIQKILNIKQTATQQEIKALILAPSKELCHQICGVIKDLTIKCSREVRYIDIAPQGDLAAQKPLLVEKPDIVVATPARALQHVKAGNLHLKKSLELLVIDEADLVFSFGYEEEMRELMSNLPKIYQAILASATLSEDVKNLKNLVLHNPVTLKLEEPELAPASQLTHYHLNAEEMDKATILYALLKLHLIRGKTIIFVNTVDRCYKLKLYLEQFAIPTCVLNSELPAAVRCHSVSQFNRGVYDVIIASDEQALEAPAAPPVRSGDGKKSKRRKDKESGVSRGIDFQCVANVVNFDFPLDVQAYVHRAGRTARGNNQGSVLSFVSMKEKPLLDKVEAKIRCGQEDVSVFKHQGYVKLDAEKMSLVADKVILGAELIQMIKRWKLSYQFKLEELESFKYRAKDAWRAVTRIAVREARLKEIKQEIFNCQKLKTYFEDNPTDLQVLRHDKALHTVRIQRHLSDVPEYILPPTLKSLAGITKNRKRKREFRRSDSATSKFENDADIIRRLVNLVRANAEHESLIPTGDFSVLRLTHIPYE